VDPRIVIDVCALRGYLRREFLIDTGAELSVVPRYLAREIGLDWDSLPAVRVIGVGAGQVPTRMGSLPIKIGPIELSVRCLCLDQPVAPFILGCADVLDRFALTIDAGRGRIVLTEIL